MVKSENFYTEESANRKINQLRDEGKRLTNKEKIERAKKDIGEIIDGIQRFQDTVKGVDAEELERVEDIKLYLMIAFENVALAVATAEKK